MAQARYEPDDEPDDWDGDDDIDTIPCPYCGAEIIEDAEQCPRCGNYLSKEDRPSTGKSAAWWILMLLALAVAALWVVG